MSKGRYDETLAGEDALYIVQLCLKANLIEMTNCIWLAIFTSANQNKKQNKISFVDHIRTFMVYLHTFSNSIFSKKLIGPL